MTTITNGKFSISTDKEKLDIKMIHHYLSNSYWAKNIPIDTVIKSIEHSLCFGIYFVNKQVGFARVITDYTSFAYLADVFVLESEQGKGLGKWLIKEIMDYPSLQGLRKWLLATEGAHGLYKQYGFSPLKKPDSIMEIRIDNIYL